MSKWNAKPTGVTLLRPGRVFRPVVYQCTKCDAVMEVDPDECPNTGWGFEVDCPCCKNMVKIQPGRFARTDEEQELRWSEKE